VLAMGKNAAGGDVRDGKNIVEPSIGRTVAFLFLVSFSGMFVLMPFRKVMIIRHRLTYPNGMATAHLINSFHTPQGASKARHVSRVHAFGRLVSLSNKYIYIYMHA
jgi:uncharacterized oligopeptide transporter (OPT) family protein